MRIKASKWIIITFVFGLHLTILSLPRALASEMVFVTGGQFTMGDTIGDGLSFDKPIHQVKVSDFLMSKFEVTFDEYDAFCDAIGRQKTIDDNDGIRGKNPIMHVSWYDAVLYCNWKSKQEGLQLCYQIIDGSNVLCNFTANGYRLPTEAEWEYAARGGNRSKGYKYCGSDNADDVAWYSDNSGNRTHPVGQKQSNELGLYDMSGNDWELCWDWNGGTEYYQQCANLGIVENPKGPESSNVGRRIVRGGGSNSFAKDIQPSKRYSAEPSYNFGGGIGFRLARSSY